MDQKELTKQVDELVKMALAREKQKQRKRMLIGISVAIFLFPLGLWALIGGKPYSFSSGQEVKAEEINANFDALFKLVCPTGFTSIESQGHQLGCLQNDLQGTATCNNAILTCFDLYGGRLPSYSEIYSGFQRYSMQNTTGGYQWLDVALYAGGPARCGAITSGNSPDDNTASTVQNFRCFIPK